MAPQHTHTPRPGRAAPRLPAVFGEAIRGGPLWTRGRTEILPALPLGGPRFPLSPAPKICGSQEPRKNGGRGGFLFSSWREGQGPRDGPYSPTPKICGSWRPRKNGEGGVLVLRCEGEGGLVSRSGGNGFPSPGGMGEVEGERRSLSQARLSLFTEARFRGFWGIWKGVEGKKNSGAGSVSGPAGFRE